MSIGLANCRQLFIAVAATLSCIVAARDLVIAPFSPRLQPKSLRARRRPLAMSARVNIRGDKVPAWSNGGYRTVHGEIERRRLPPGAANGSNLEGN